MQEAIREALGKAAYEATTPLMDDAGVPARAQRKWEEADPRVRESSRLEAEAVVNRLMALVLPSVIQALFSEEEQRQLFAEAVKAVM